MTTRAREVAQRLRFRADTGDMGREPDPNCTLREAADIIEALLAEREWRSMDSAPRDWTDVLVFSPKHEGFNCGGVFSAFYDDENNQWLTHGPSMNMEISPTHWLPLPQPPEGEG